MKRLYLTAAAIGTVIFAQAQMGSGSGYLKAADKFYKKGDYYSAAQYYEKYLGKGASGGNDGFDPYTIQQLGSGKNSGVSGSEDAVLYRLAESYRQLNYYVKAEPVYAKIVSTDKANFPLSEYYYAVSLRALGKYQEAEQHFQSFLDDYKQQDNYTEAARRELRNLSFIQEQLKRSDLAQYQVNAVQAASGDGANYSPVLYNDRLLFTSTRKAEKDSKTINQLYEAQFASNTVNSISPLAIASDPKMHQGVPAISPDGNTLYLTRWTISETGKTAAIFSSSLVNGQWSEPQRLPESINAQGSSNQQPFVMPDGKHLVFASNRSGGAGGFDLWIAPLNENGVPGDAVNLGNVINTSYDEQAPYFHAASKSLVFASTGHTGMGGYDLFRSRPDGDSWTAPENLGYPLNSVKDDIYFASRGTAKNWLETVLISSDRNSDCCLDLFSVTRNLPDRTISGSVVACDNKQPVPGAEVSIVDLANGSAITSVKTDQEGKYSFTLKDFKPLKAVASKEGYKSSDALAFNAPASEEALELNNPAICVELVQPPANTAVVIPNVYYAFNETELTPESYASLDSLADIMKRLPEMTVEIGSHTDNIGTKASNLVISNRRAANVVNYLVSKGIDKSRIKSKGYGYSKPVAPNHNTDGSDNPAGREQNRRTEMKVLN